jgi:hypothetical protein
MSFINWGHESPEQKLARKRFEEDQAIFEQRAAAISAAAAAAAGSGKIIDNSWIGQAKSRLRSRYTEVTSLVPNIYLFWDDYTTDEDGNPMPGIEDGGDDMYDGGNYLNTNLTNAYDTINGGEIDENDALASASIPYTHTQPNNEDDSNENFNPPMDGKIEDGTLYFGEGSKYFTNMYPGIFMMLADNIAVTEFSITGDVGSDEDTINGGSVEDVIPNWTLFWKTNYGDSTDPSINHLILVPGTSSGITHEFEDDNGDDNDDHAVIGIGDRSRIVYALVATQPGEDVLTDSQFISIAEKLLQIIL